MSFSKDYRTYSDDELELMKVLEGEAITLQFNTQGELLYLRHRMYALRNALVQQYTKEMKSRPNASHTELSDPILAIAPRIAKMSILVDGLKMTLGVGIMRTGIRTAIADALASKGFTAPSANVAKERLRKELEIQNAIANMDLNIPIPGAPQGAYGQGSDGNADDMGNTLADLGLSPTIKKEK